MEFNMMAGYGDYNWSVILWLFVGIVIFIAVISIVMRKVNRNRDAYLPGKDVEQDVLKERKTGRDSYVKDPKKQKKDSQK